MQHVEKILASDCTSIVHGHLVEMHFGPAFSEISKLDEFKAVEWKGGNEWPLGLQVHRLRNDAQDGIMLIAEAIRRALGLETNEHFVTTGDRQTDKKIIIARSVVEFRRYFAAITKNEAYQKLWQDVIKSELRGLIQWTYVARNASRRDNRDWRNKLIFHIVARVFRREFFLL